MKVLFFLILVSVTICYGMPGNRINLEGTVMRMMFLKLVKEKCYQNSTSQYDRFIVLTDNSIECIRAKIKKSPILVTPLKDFKDNIQGCVDDFVDELEECLPEDSKDWPQLNFDIFYSIIDFVYENKDQILSPTFTSYIEECVANLQDEKAKNELGQCFKKYEPVESLEIKTLCRVLSGIEKCISGSLSYRCPSDPNTEKLKIGFLAALKEPCVEYEITENPVDNVFTLLSQYAPPNMNPELM